MRFADANGLRHDVVGVLRRCRLGILERKTVESGAVHPIIDARPNTASAKFLATHGRPYMRVMTYRSGGVARAAGVRRIAAEAVALQRLSALCQDLSTVAVLGFPTRLHPLQMGHIRSAAPCDLIAILLVCICWPTGQPAHAQIGACPQTASDEIPAAPPEHVGMRSGRLADAIKSLRGKDRDIHALVVLRNCKVVVELYAENVTRDHNHAVYSVTKSFCDSYRRALEERKAIVVGDDRCGCRCHEHEA